MIYHHSKKKICCIFIISEHILLCEVENIFCHLGKKKERNSFEKNDCQITFFIEMNKNFYLAIINIHFK